MSGGREEGQVCGRGQESRGSDVCVMTRRVRFGSRHLVSIGERCTFFFALPVTVGAETPPAHVLYLLN